MLVLESLESKFKLFGKNKMKKDFEGIFQRDVLPMFR